MLMHSVPRLGRSCIDEWLWVQEELTSSPVVEGLERECSPPWMCDVVSA